MHYLKVDLILNHLIPVTLFYYHLLKSQWRGVFIFFHDCTVVEKKVNIRKLIKSTNLTDLCSGILELLLHEKQQIKNMILGDINKTIRM